MHQGENRILGHSESWSGLQPSCDSKGHRRAWKLHLFGLPELGEWDQVCGWLCQNGAVNVNRRWFLQEIGMIFTSHTLEISIWWIRADLQERETVERKSWCRFWFLECQHYQPDLPWGCLWSPWASFLKIFCWRRSRLILLCRPTSLSRRNLFQRSLL